MATVEHHIGTGRPGADRRAWLGLVVLSLPTLLVSLDLFVVLLAVPRLGVALGASSTDQLWILDVYGFMVAGFLVTMGTLGDRLGRRRLLLIGAAAFGAASILAAYSVTPELLILSRALLGIAGATLTPSTLSLITNLFQEPRQRAVAVGIWAGCFAAGAIIGPMVGGIMLEHFWWGSVFLLGVPVMALLLAVGPTLLPEFRNPQAGRLDLASVALSLLAILPVVYGLKTLARDGWQPPALVAVAAGSWFAVGFARRQRRLASPLLDLQLFANRAFSTTLCAMLAYTMLSGGTMVFVVQHFQLAAGLSPLRSGLALLPGMAAAIISFQVAPILARRTRPATLFAGGLAVGVTGLLLLTQTPPGSGLAIPVAGFLLTCVGGGPLVALGTNLLVSFVPPEKAGTAAGVAQTGNELGYALGIAVLGSLGTAIYRAKMAGTGVPDLAADTFAGATATAASLPADTAAQLLAMARDAFASGFHAVAIAAAAALAGVAVLILATLRHLPPLGASSTHSSDTTPTLEQQ